MLLLVIFAQCHKEYIKIEENTEKLKSIFWPTLQKLRHIIDNGAYSEELIKIENKLIELQKNILDLIMMLAEVINKEKDQEES